MDRAKLSFGSFCLDDEQRQLLRNGAPVHLSPKAYDLLMVLVAERPRAIAKNELHDRLWPGTFVTDASLATLVAELRAALGQTGRRSGLVRTVHGFGYAFSGEVVEDPRGRAPAVQLGESAACVLLLGAREFELLEGENIVGRDEGADIRLHSQSVSRRHARIAVSGGRAVIEDLDSKNGTTVEGRRVVAATPLHDRDRIQIGTFMFTFRAVSARGTTSTM